MSYRSFAPLIVLVTLALGLGQPGLCLSETGIWKDPPSSLQPAAEKALDQFKALASNDARAMGTFEDVYSRIMARFGKKDEAISSLQRALSQPCDGVTGMPPTPALLRLDPDYDSLRNDPRFEALCQKKL